MEQTSSLPISEHDQEQLRALESKINAILPPRYAGCFEDVPPTSMGSAKLKRDADGRVVWGEIWTTFCHLALAGGPPHRGRLLPPVPTGEAKEHPAEQHAVVAEIEARHPIDDGFEDRAQPHARLDRRALLRRRHGRLAGAGDCRRECHRPARRNVLYVPAGPHFQIEKEIKNVVVSLAKTCHYLLDHTRAEQRPSGLARSLVEPARPTRLPLRRPLSGGCRRDGTRHPRANRPGNGSE